MTAEYLDYAFLYISTIFLEDLMVLTELNV
jgi:hypothetical protein